MSNLLKCHICVTDSKEKLLKYTQVVLYEGLTAINIKCQLNRRGVSPEIFKSVAL